MLFRYLVLLLLAQISGMIDLTATPWNGPTIAATIIFAALLAFDYIMMKNGRKTSI